LPQAPAFVVESLRRKDMLARVNPLRTATEKLSGEFSMSRPEAQRSLSDQVLQGLMAHGYAIHDKRSDRYAVSAAGRRMLAETSHD
jgi:ribosomal protein S19E (S16A)